MNKKVPIELSEAEITRCVSFLDRLSFSMIQELSSNFDVEETHLNQDALLQLRNQLECFLEAIELAREKIEGLTTYDLYYIGGDHFQRLTESCYVSKEEATSLIPDVIQHTEEEIGEPVDDPQNYVILANWTTKLR